MTGKLVAAAVATRACVAGEAWLGRTLRRREVVGLFKVQPAWVVLEACGAAHHWGRVLGGLGHAVW